MPFNNFRGTPVKPTMPNQMQNPSQFSPMSVDSGFIPTMSQSDMQRFQQQYPTNQSILEGVKPIPMPQMSPEQFAQMGQNLPFTPEEKKQIGMMTAEALKQMFGA